MWCPACQQEKSTDDFYTIRGAKYNTYCRSCISQKAGETYRQTKDAEAIKVLGEPKHCAICGKVFDKNNRPCLDHCHKTGRLRGWLCYACNTALGKFKDNPMLLRYAAYYIESFK